MCPDPLAIVMDAVRGVRVMSGPDEDQRIIAEEHIALLARMHHLSTESFAAIGLKVPITPEEIGLGMLDAYMPLYNRTKAAPEPLIEFLLPGRAETYRRTVRTRRLCTGMPGSSFTRTAKSRRFTISRPVLLVTAYGSRCVASASSS